MDPDNQKDLINHLTQEDEDKYCLKKHDQRLIDLAKSSNILIALSKLYGEKK